MTTLDHPLRRDVRPADPDAPDSPEDFGAFLRQHERWARGYLRRLLDGNDHDVEDAWQDVSLRLWLSWPPTTSPRGLLATVVRHVAVDFTRTKQFSQARMTDPLGDVDPPSDSADPLDEVVLMEQRTAVREALRELPMDQRRLVFDRHHCETPFAVLADEHGTTSTALRSKEGRVLRKLRTRLADTRAGMPVLLLRADMRLREWWWHTQEAVGRIMPGAMSTALTSLVLTTLVVVPTAAPAQQSPEAQRGAGPFVPFTQDTAGASPVRTATRPVLEGGSALPEPRPPAGSPQPTQPPRPSLPVRPPDPDGAPCVGSGCENENVDVITVTVPITGDRERVGQGWVPVCGAWPKPANAVATCHTEGDPNYIVEPDPSPTPTSQPAEG